jgi:hypothetical protein
VDTNLDLLGHPFDQYQRYQDIRLVVDTIWSHQADRALSILDVGGSPLTTKFMPDCAVVSANIEIGPGVHLQCDGACLPFRDNAFDVVITVDTLEHVPENQRKAFICELLRVSGAYTIITGPFANGYNEAAEAALNDFLEDVVGYRHRFLIEHLENGLPDLAACLRAIADSGGTCLTIPSGYVHHWLPLMIIKHDLLRLADGQDISDELDRFYNYLCYWSDHRLPSYRQVIVASKLSSDDILLTVEHAFAPPEQTPPPDLNGVVGMWQALRWSQVLRERDKEIDRLRAENQRLNVLVSAYASGRFMRLMVALERLRAALRKK